MRISDWSSDVCSSDLSGGVQLVQIVDIAFEVVQSLDAQHRADRHGLAAAPRREQGIEVDRIGDRAELAVRCPGGSVQLFGVPERTLEQRIPRPHRSEEHTSELQSLMRTSYAVFCL